MARGCTVSQFLDEDNLAWEASGEPGVSTACEAGAVSRGLGARRRQGVWARVFVVVHVLVVVAPLLIVALWAGAAAWPWPALIPTAWTTRGIELVLSSGLECLGLSVGIAMASAAVATLVATAAARAVVCHRWLGRQLFRFGVLLPFLIPTTVFAMGVQVAFIRLGLAGSVGGVILAHTVVALPHAVAIMVDATAAAGTRLEEAARSLGASPLRAFDSVTLPLLVPGLVTSLSMGYILSMSQYFLTLLVGSGQVKTFALTLFPYLSGGDRTVAGAYGLVFILATLVVFFGFEALMRRLRVAPVRELYGS